METPNDYKLLFQFVDTYLPVGFEGIGREDPLMRKVYKLMKKNNQFFYIADMIQLEMLYKCSSIDQILGIKSSEFTPIVEFELVHPDDMKRFSVARSKVIKLTGNLFAEKTGSAIISSNFRFRHAKGHYFNLLIQVYGFYSQSPKPSIYTLVIYTDISWFGPIKHGYHFYTGKDMSYFRVPDKKLVSTGNIFSNREFEILKLIRDGQDSSSIGDKLFISSHTVDTHRRNILKKTAHKTTAELIFDLNEQGYF